MKILKRVFRKRAGMLVLMPQSDQDLWHAYNLINVGDIFKMSTFRKVINTSATGVKNTEKKKMTIKITVKSVDYFANGDCLTIEVRGKNLSESQYLQIGQHHSFILQQKIAFSLYKSNWQKYHLNVIKQIQNQDQQCEIAAIVMDLGIANFCYVKTIMTIVKARIERNIPKKSAGQHIIEKLTNSFFNQCFKTLLTMNLSSVKCLIIGSPGFVKDSFYQFIRDQFNLDEFKEQRAIMQKIVLVHTNTGFKSSLSQALQDEKIKNKIKDTKAMKQTKVLQRFFKVLSKNAKLIAYGDKDVSKAYNQRAIQSLLIVDSLFRTKDLKKRRQYNQLVDRVRKEGGQVHIFSILHPSGQKLQHISGIAAILRFDIEFQDGEWEQAVQIQQQQSDHQQQKQGLHMLEQDCYDDFM